MSGKLTLGPVLFNWAADEWRDFYLRMADEAPLDAVYLGEVVCSKRQPFTEPHWAAVTERLEAAGKQVIHSTLALLMSERELELTRELIETAGPERLIEANDISAVSLLGGRPHVIGPHISCYNEGTLGYFTGRGAARVALPAELGAGALEPLAASGIELEMQVFGRLPLALSARCYHARSHDLHKDNCQFVCAEDADGMALETLDGEPFLAVNGTQTLSHGYYNLAGETGALAAAGISHFRLSPHAMDMAEVARIFRQLLDGETEAGAAIEALRAQTGDAPFANGFFHGRAGVEWSEAALE